MPRIRRRSAFSAIARLWPLGMALALLAVTAGFFWLLAREVRFERQPVKEVETAGKK